MLVSGRFSFEQLVFFVYPTLFLWGCDRWIAESKESIRVVGFKMILCKLDVPKKTKNPGKKTSMSISLGFLETYFKRVLVGCSRKLKRFGEQPLLWSSMRNRMFVHILELRFASMWTCCGFVVWTLPQNGKHLWKPWMIRMMITNSVHIPITRYCCFRYTLSFFWVVKQPSQFSYLASH